MAHVQDVAAYILGKLGTMTAMKLQKLCYFAYGYHLAWEERPLFPERFEAWANGPVSPALYALHRGRFYMSPGDLKGDAAALDEGERLDRLGAGGIRGVLRSPALGHDPRVRAVGGCAAPRRRRSAGPMR